MPKGWNTFMKTLCKVLFALSAASTFLFADATDVTPKKVGPVSYYGALHTNGNKIVGAKNGAQAMLRGMSLFWSDATGEPYYNKTVIDWATDNLKIDVFRFAMGIEYYNSDGGTSNAIDASSSYKGNPGGMEGILDRMVAAAIENDVYIIVDWHSHRAHYETSLANSFFSKISAKYKDVPNIIYEIYNEPVNGSGGNWGNIKSYANTVSASIRKNTDNLIIVGTPVWSQNPQQGASDPVSAKNIAYVFHFYAATHSKGSFSGNIESALNKGYPVFISEWGTTNADGDGDPNTSATNDWTSYMDQKKIPNCNWSFRQKTSHIDNKSEKSAFFDGSSPLITEKDLNEATLTASGSIVKSYLTKNARTWADSLTKGKRSGSCAATHVVAKETEATISGKLKSGCTYTSSNESVVTVSGSTLTIHGYGYSILTGNDGSQTVVTIQRVAGQTINGFMDMVCRYKGNCTSAKGSSRLMDYDGDGKIEWTFPPSGKTDQGMTFTLKSLDPTYVEVGKSKCSVAGCSSTQKENPLWMYQMNKFGSSKIVATAEATTGYRAMQDTIVVEYRKAQNTLSTLKSYKFALGERVENMFRDISAYGSPVTYTFDGEATSPYVTKDGSAAIAGNTKAIVTVVATIPETDSIEALKKTVIFTIGDTTAPVIDLSSDSSNPGSSDSYTPGGKPITPPEAIGTVIAAQGLNANVHGGILHINSNRPEPIYVDIYDMIGNKVFQQVTIDAATSPSVALGGLPQGSYVVRIRQQSQRLTLRWVSK